MKKTIVYPISFHVLSRHVFAIGLFITSMLLLSLAGCSGGGSGGGDDPTPTPRYTVSGTILAEANMAIDSDVNDPLAEYAANDDFANAQELDNPATVGGYANRSMAGATGRSRIAGDIKDIYTAYLEADETITLFVADSDAVFDFFLYTTSDTSTVVVSEPGITDSATLTIPTDDDYYIEVKIISGASNYTLTIGQSTISSSGSGLRLSSDFVPGEAIVKFIPGADISSAAQTKTALAKSQGFVVKNASVGPAILVKFDTDQQKTAVFRSLGIDPVQGTGIPSVPITDPEMQKKMDTLKVIKALRDRPDVAYAEPNYRVYAFADPDDEYFDLQWHYDLIHLSEAWDVPPDSGEVIVAVIDTGVLVNHPDLADRLVDGYDFIENVASAGDGDGVDDDPDDPGDGDIGNSSFHGTHVAGTIAAETNNSVGVAGVGRGTTRIMPVRALGKAGGVLTDVINSIYYAAGIANGTKPVPAEAADIINMSIGHSGSSQAELEAITAARNAGVIIIAAAGNERTSTPKYPAAYTGVVSVSAVDIQRTLASYSNFGGSIDVAAPGGDQGDLNNDGYTDGVLSTIGDDSVSTSDPEYTYAFLMGTSMAAPHVAGVAALMKNLDPAMTPDDFDAYLISGEITDDLGTAGRDNSYGHGLINAQKAVYAVQNGAPTVLSVSPNYYNIGSGEDSFQMTAEKLGGDELEINDPVSNQAWLTVTGSSIDAFKLGQYQATVDRDMLDAMGAGVFYATITYEPVDFSMNTVIVTLSAQSMVADPNADAGYHYVLLVDGDDLLNGVWNVVSDAGIEAESGRYAYEFTNVRAGNYFIYAGTDLNNDYYLGDNGEAVSAYSSYLQPFMIEVDADTAGLDFTTGFRTTLPLSVSSVDGEPMPMRRMDDAKRIRR
ncbi:MAG: S8 family serine peptidase [Desulfobacteraceae bacterium]|nr:S8 family serine peptidase [Desulfobacteraceae bacterium]